MIPRIWCVWKVKLGLLFSLIVVDFFAFCSAFCFQIGGFYCPSRLGEEPRLPVPHPPWGGTFELGNAGRVVSKESKDSERYSLTNLGPRDNSTAKHCVTCLGGGFQRSRRARL